jgi:hypothetical protein
LEKIEKEFNLFGIQTHPIPLNPHGLSANRTSPKCVALVHKAHTSTWVQVKLPGAEYKISLPNDHQMIVHFILPVYI